MVFRSPYHAGIVHHPEANQEHFLSNRAGDVIEIYCDPADQVPDYANQDPLVLHLAFVSSDTAADAQRLIDIGATWEEEKKPIPETQIIMRRDLWGFAIQLCKRTLPLGH